MKAPSPLLGFNNNVRHRGRVFHIQTEDSGIRHPHIITHLFADGGRILKTIKTSYAEHLGQERIADTVRAMMQEQHKADVHRPARWSVRPPHRRHRPAFVPREHRGHRGQRGG